MRFEILLSGVLLASWGLGADVAATDEPAAKKSEAPTSEQIAKWIAQLDAPELATREQAQRYLAEARSAAVGPLTEVARSGSFEARDRAFQILRRLSHAEDGQAKAKARQALAELARSEDTAVASVAMAALKPKPKSSEELDPAEALMRELRRGRVGARVEVRGAGVRSVSITQSGDRRTVDAREGDRRVQIDESKADGVKVVVTEKVDGKEKKTEYKAESVEKLKEKHPKGHEIYKQYSRSGRGGVQLEFGPGAIPPPGLPEIKPPDKIELQIEDDAKDPDPAREASRVLEEINKSLERALREARVNDRRIQRDLDRVLEELQRDIEPPQPESTKPKKADEDAKS